MTNKTLNLAAIRLDGNTQARVSIHQDTVAEYAAVITEGDILPAITVFFDGVDYWLGDGFHRLFAHKEAKKVSIVADVLTGTCRDAILYSLAANTVHGLRPNNEDKRKAVGIMLADPEWSQLSDREIGKHCGCSHMTVGRIRKPAPEPAPTALGTTPMESGTSATKNTATKTGASGTSATEPAKKDDKQLGTGGTSATPAPEPKPEKEVYTPLEAALDQVQELQAMLVVANMGDVAPEAKDQAKDLITELREENRKLRANLKAVTTSRDTLMNELAMVKRQCISLQAKLKKAA